MNTTEQKNSALLKNIMLLLMALAFGALAFWLSSQHLAQKEAELEASLQGKSIRNVAIIVASTNIQEGTPVSGENLAVAEVPAAHEPLDALSPEEFEHIDGRTALRDIPQGRPILRSYISSALTERFSDLLNVGQRALTFSVDALNSSDGMLKPGDRVDLFLLSNPIVGSAEIDEKELIPLLQNITVLATGKNPVVPIPEQGGSGEWSDTQYNTLTVAVTPEQAQRVLIAKDSGSIVTLLRNRHDNQQLPASILHYSSLKHNGNQVEYFTGSKAEAGALKAEMKPVHSISASPEMPLQFFKENQSNESKVAISK